MSAFSRDWIKQFKSDQHAADRKVREAYRAPARPVVTPPPARRGRPPGLKRLLPPVIHVKVPADLPQLLTAREAAQALRLKDPESVIRRIRSGELHGYKEGNSWRIPLWAIAHYLAEKGSGAA